MGSDPIRMGHLARKDLSNEIWNWRTLWLHSTVKSQRTIVVETATHRSLRWRITLFEGAGDRQGEQLSRSPQLRQSSSVDSAAALNRSIPAAR